MIIRFDTIHERNWRTDTQTDTAWRHRPRLCIASRSKNWTHIQLGDRWRCVPEHDASVTYIDDDDEDDPSLPLYHTMPYVCGKVLLASVLDSLVAAVSTSPLRLISFRASVMHMHNVFYPSVRSSVNKLVNTIFQKWMNQFLCQSARIAHKERAWNVQLLGSGGQRSRSQNAQIDQTYEQDVSKTDEPILLQIGTSSRRGKGHETINFGGLERPKLDLEAWRRHRSWLC